MNAPPELPDAVADFKVRQWPARTRNAVLAEAAAERTINTLGRLLAAGEMPAEARRAIGNRVGRHLATAARARKVLATVPQRHGGQS